MLSRLWSWIKTVFNIQPTPIPNPIIPVPPKPVDPINPVDPVIPTPPIPPEPLMLKLHNDYRQSRGLSTLTVNDKLSAACKYHTNWMSATNKLSHTGQGRSSPVDRARQFGYTDSYPSENIAWGTAHNDEQIFQMWLNSRGHLNNITGSHKEMGFARTGNYWCVMFGG